MCISTYVFFDIETTGLPHLEKNKTKITELAFIAVSAEEIEATPFRSLPLINKLSLLFNPERKISSKAEIISGLSNTRLAQQPTFKRRIITLNSFLDELPKPVCLIAHNGNRFDFKILVTEFKDAGAEFPTDLLCIDSLNGFKKILKENKTVPNSSPKLISLHTSSPNSTIEEIITDDEDEWPKLNASVDEWRELDELTLSLSNMSTSEENNKKNTSKSKGTCNKGDTAKAKVSYTLSDLYRRLLNKEPMNAHRAEVDCMMLLECVIATKSTFLPWAENAVVLLRNIQPLLRQF